VFDRRRLTAFALVLLSCKAKSVEQPTSIPGRSYRVLSPKNVAPGSKLPALVVLHAFGTSPETQAGFFDVERTFLSQSFFVVLPEGRTDKDGDGFWNATDSCCDHFGQKPDDVAYLDAVLDHAVKHYPIDPKQVFFAGVSNGGFMAQRYACDRPERVRGFVSVSGALWEDLTKCATGKAVAALLIHGDADEIVRYQGGTSLIGNDARYPSAPVAAQFWAKRAGATLHSTAQDSGLQVQSWSGGTAPVELWTVQGGGHRLPRSSGLANQIAAFFERARGP
jgi:polyhydroxybutyrate depolymerase